MKKITNYIPTGLKSIFRSLRYRNFRLFFSGQSISLIGTWMQRIAMPWLVFELTGSVFLLGLVGFLGQIPAFIISPFAGVFADRWNRYYVMIATQILSMLQALILFYLAQSHTVQVWHLIVLSIFLGCINAIDIPVRQSFVIKMVDRKEDLSNAIALNSTMVNGAKLLGPSLAGVLIALAGVNVCFLINGLSYLLVITSMLFMKVEFQAKNKKALDVFGELKTGFAYTIANIPIKHILLLLSLVSLMGMPYIVLLPVIAKDILHGGSETFGFLMGASGVGALMGALYLASRKCTQGLEKLIPYCAGVFGLGLVAFSLSSNYYISLAMMVITGLGMMLQLASSNTLIQTIVDDSKRGRVMGFYTMAFMGTAPFGSIMAGSAAKLVGAPLTILVGGITCIIGAIVYFGKLPEITRIVNEKRHL